MPTRLVEVRQRVLKHNDVVARALRARFQRVALTGLMLLRNPLGRRPRVLSVLTGCTGLVSMGLGVVWGCPLVLRLVA